MFATTCIRVQLESARLCTHNTIIIITQVSQTVNDLITEMQLTGCEDTVVLQQRLMLSSTRKKVYEM